VLPSTDPIKLNDRGAGVLKSYTSFTSAARGIDDLAAAYSKRKSDGAHDPEYLRSGADYAALCRLIGLHFSDVPYPAGNAKYRAGHYADVTATERTAQAAKFQKERK
jgi:hypothetical protein